MSGVKRIPEIQARLDRWGIWVNTGSSGGGSTHPLARLMDWKSGKRVSASGNGGYGAFVPAHDIECSLTDEAIGALPVELRQAVRAWHASPGGGTLEGVARRLGVVKTTLWRRLAQADQRISEWLFERQGRSLVGVDRGACDASVTFRITRHKPDRA